MMNAPVNVRFETPTQTPVDWSIQAQKWADLNSVEIVLQGRSVRGHPGFYPLTIKAAYVIGVIHDLCLSVSRLLSDRENSHRFYLPAYGVFASAVDLLGRCIQGNNTHQAHLHQTSDILAGFRWFHTPDYTQFSSVSSSEIFITTSNNSYTIAMMMAMRHFVAHGQGTTNANIYTFQDIDYDILEQMPQIIARGIESYWNALQGGANPDTSEVLCNQLARAQVEAFRNWPIYNSWLLFQGDGSGESITNIFNRLNWKVR